MLATGVVAAYAAAQSPLISSTASAYSPAQFRTFPFLSAAICGGVLSFAPPRWCVMGQQRRFWIGLGRSPLVPWLMLALGLAGRF